MRFLPVFLDLQTGPVLLVGGGELARAKLRLLAAAGARFDGMPPTAMMTSAGSGRRTPPDRDRRGDPLAADLRRHCGAVRRRRRHRSRDVGAGQGGGCPSM